MEFPTIQFAGFALLVLTLSWLLRGQRTLQKIFLLAVSYYFAWKWQPLFLAVIVGSSLVNWAVGEALFKVRAEPARKRILILGLLLNIGVLGFFKYYGFFVDSVASLAEFIGMEAHLPLLEVLAPFGISFYTFQGMAFLVDTYRDKSVRPRTVLDFLLFIAFFPQLAAGPICRARDFLPQIMGPAPKGIPQLSQAVVLIGVGLFKKMIIGTFLASHLTTDAFIAPDNYSSLELVLAVFAYTAQVYVDFSGYTDIARGVGYLFGFELPENFNYPYAATNIGDFWRRWHITFSTWLREYIYFPLGGSRGSRLRCYFNLMVTFVACGVWHGASWGYIIWGALHGLGLTLYKASLDVRRDVGMKADGPWPIWWKAMGWAMTISFCAFARIFFKVPNLDTAWEYWARLGELSFRGAGIDVGVVVLTVLVFLMNAFGRRPFNAMVRFHEQIPQPVRPLAWAAMMLALFTIKPYGMAATIYFSF